MSDPRFRIRANCRACGSQDLPTVVELNPLPLVSPNVGVESRAAAAAANVTVPADLHLCGECGLLQLAAVIDPRFQYNKFKYLTTISIGLPEHFERSADQILAVSNLKPPGRVLEIGSNDGTLLRAFRQRGWEILGIDPAEKAAEVARSRYVPTTVGFFNEESAREIVAQAGLSDLVIANNTLANIDDLRAVARGLDIVLGADGVFAFETSYGANVVRNVLLDTIYHEHLSYFMVRPLRSYFARYGFELFHVEQINTKGGSIRGFVQRSGGSRATRDSVDALIAKEEHDGLYEKAAYQRMSSTIDEMKRKLESILVEARVSGQTVGAYGASVGCVTLINQLGLAPYIACIFDDQPLLDAVIGPNYHIPVVNSDEIYKQQPDLIVILAWRYSDLIVKKHAAFQKRGGRFILPLPEVAVQ